MVTPDPLRGLYCAVTRNSREGTPVGGWLPEQSISLESALRHYTVDAAYGSFDEDDSRPGYGVSQSTIRSPGIF